MIAPLEPPAPSLRPRPVYRPCLFWFSLLALVWTVLLLFAGGVTTSIEAGMAFLDWPLSNGSVNPEGWLEDPHQTAEHSHRLIGAVLGLLSIALVVWNEFTEKRGWVRWMARGLLAVVILQGLLGGLRVLLDQLNTGAPHNLVAQGFAIAHACGALVVVGLLVSHTAAQSRPWIARRAGLREPVALPVRAWGVAAVSVLFLTVLFGAMVRHLNLGPLLDGFPPFVTAQGALLPEYWSWAVAIHFAHRTLGFIAGAVLFAFLYKLYRSPATGPGYAALALVPFFLVFAQIFLGGIVVKTGINEHAATTHMLAGALLIAISWLLTFLTFRLPPASPAASKLPDCSPGVAPPLVSDR